MERSFDVDDVQKGPPDWPTLLRRGLRRRCPRCGGRDLFEDRFRIKVRCPTCGLRIAREPGFRVGAWFLNFMFIGLIHWIAVMGWIIWRSSRQSAPLFWPMLLAGVTAVVIPIITYPWSLTMWAAVDLGMTPLELHEIVDAADSLEGGGEGGVEGGDVAERGDRGDRPGAGEGGPAAP